MPARVCVLTGATSGIGRAAAFALARQGFSLGLVCRSREKGERTALDAKEFRNADALLHVVRAFSDEARGSPDPRRDILDLELELIFADLEVVDRRVERLEVSIKKQRKDAEVQEHAVLTRLKAALEAETPLRAVALAPEEVRLIRGFTFLSQKPILHLVNVEEAGIVQAETIVERQS